MNGAACHAANENITAATASLARTSFNTTVLRPVQNVKSSLGRHATANVQLNDSVNTENDGHVVELLQDTDETALNKGYNLTNTISNVNERGDCPTHPP